MKADFVETDKAVLALGEVTGHSHQILAPLKVKKDASGLTTEFILEQPAQIIHEEHDTISLEPGSYKVVRQREYDLTGEIRQVMD